jgi:hypothetical protein
VYLEALQSAKGEFNQIRLRERITPAGDQERILAPQQIGEREEKLSGP